MSDAHLSSRYDEFPEDVEQMWICGRHSGFPDCCIEFCVEHWWPWESKRPPWTRVYETLLTLVPQMRGRKNGYGYIPCPTCLVLNRIVKVKRCKCYDEYRKEHGIE